MDCPIRTTGLAGPWLPVLCPYLPSREVLEKPLMTEPVFAEIQATHDLYRATARIEARKELAEELRKIQKPTKQLVDIIKRLETNAETI